MGAHDKATIPPPSKAAPARIAPLWPAANVCSMRRMIFALFIEFEAGVIGVDHSGLQMGLCNALFKFEALHYAGIVVLRFIYACRDWPHLHGARREGSH